MPASFIMTTLEVIMLSFFSMVVSVMSVCMPVKISFVDQQVNSLYGNITTSLINSIQVCARVYST